MENKLYIVPSVGQPSSTYWPADLKELFNEWDNLPEQRIGDVVRWLQPFNSNGPQPKIIREIQEMWANMPETWEEKVDLVLEGHDEQKGSDPPSSTMGASSPISGTYNALLVDRATLPSNLITLNSPGASSSDSASHLRSVALLSMNRAKVVLIFNLLV